MVVIYLHDFKSAFINIHLGILKIIDKSSNKLLLFDRNFILVFGELLNILKNISGIFSGCLSKTFKNILSNSLYFFLFQNVLYFEYY